MEESKAKFENLCKFMKKILDKKVENVTISSSHVYSQLYCEKHQGLHIQHGMDHEGAGILK